MFNTFVKRKLFDPFGILYRNVYSVFHDLLLTQKAKGFLGSVCKRQTLRKNFKKASATLNEPKTR